MESIVLENASEVNQNSRTRNAVKRTRDRLEWSQWMAGKGLTTFIVEPNSKRPLGGHSWYVRNTQDPGQLKEWFDETPNCNWAAHPGRDFVVLDLDVKCGIDGVSGIEAFETICKENGIESFLLEFNTLIVRTPSAGYHLYFKTPRPCANKHTFPLHIDVRGAVGYVVGPGSKIDAGEWVVEDESAPIMDIPDFLLKYLESPGHKDPNHEVPVVELDLDENIRQAMDFLTAEAPAIEGENGDQHTYDVCCYLRDFGISEAEALRLMFERIDDREGSSWNERCEPPWDASHLEVKIENSYEYGQNRPGCKALSYERDKLLQGRPEGGWAAVLTDEQVKAMGHAMTAEALAETVQALLKLESEGVPPVEGPERIIIRITQADLLDNLELLNFALVENELPVYERGQSVMTLDRLTETRVKNGIRRTEGSYVIGDVGARLMQQFAMGGAGFMKWNERKKGWVPTECSLALADHYLANHRVRTLRHLHGIVQAPTLRADGSIVQRDGYDEASKLFVALRGKFLEIEDEPTHERAVKALKFLRRIVREVCFAGRTERNDTKSTEAESVWLAAVVTAVIRTSIRTAPLFGFSAPVKGSGKTLLADLVGVIATGGSLAAMSAPRGEEEMEKRLFALLRAGDPVALIDNISEPLKSDSLNVIITSDFYQGRPLGKSRVETVPVACTFLATGNNFKVSGDLARRTLICYIDPRMENPDQRRFDWDPRTEAQSVRGNLVAAVLTIVRAYLAAKAKGDASTELELVPFGSFEDWDRFVRAPLVWLGMDDPVGSRRRVAEDDEEDADQQEFVAAWVAVFGSQEVKLSKAHDMCGRAEGDDDRKDKLNELWEIMEVVAPARNGGVDTRALGRWLGSRVDRVCDGRVFTRTKGGGNAVKWSLPRLIQETTVPE